MPETKTVPGASVTSSAAPSVDEAIATPGPPSGSFDDIVEGAVPGTAESARLLEELRNSNFGSPDVRDWTEFKLPDYLSGDYPCLFEQRYLREAIAITKHAVGVSPKHSGVKITVTRDKLQFTTANHAAFADVQYPLLAPAPTIENGRQVSLILDHAILAKIAATCPDAILNFVLQTDPPKLIIQAGKMRLDLCTLPKTFTDYRNKLVQPNYVQQINPTILREAVRYNALWVKKNHIQQNLSVMAIKDSQAIGGSVSCIGFFKSDAFTGLNLSIRRDHLLTLENILMAFNRYGTHLFETETYYVLRDRNRIFGFEKTPYCFPELHSVEHGTGDCVLVSRGQILDELRRISIVSTGPDQLVLLDLQGCGGMASLILTTKDGNRKTAHTRVECSRFPADDKKMEFERWLYWVNLADLITAFSHFETPNILLELGSHKALFILDEGDGFTARTVLSLMDRVPRLTPSSRTSFKWDRS